MISAASAWRKGHVPPPPPFSSHIRFTWLESLSVSSSALDVFLFPCELLFFTPKLLVLHSVEPNRSGDKAREIGLKVCFGAFSGNEMKAGSISADWLSGTC